MTAYRDVVLADNPIAFFEFNETSGGTVNSTVNGWTASVNGGVTLNQSGPKNSKAVYFDGSTGFLQIDGFTDFQATNNFTVELWAKYASVPMDYPTFMRRDGNGRTLLLRTRGDSNTARSHDIETYNSGYSNYMNSGSYGNDQWHHIYFSSYFNNNRLWVDTIENTYENGTVSAGGTGTAAPLFIGKGAGATEYFKGYIANVAIYPNEIYNASTHYNADPNVTTPAGPPPFRGWGMPITLG